VLVGVLGTHAFYFYQFRHPGGLAAIGTRFLAHDLQRRLDLTPAQQTQLRKILRESRTDAVALRRRMLPGMRGILERTQGEIRAMLTPEQRREFERFQRRHYHRMGHFLAFPP
jgi:hypothetical protein